MQTTQTNPMVEEYVARCSVLLWDLSPKLQDQLREDIRQIVGEVAMELDGQPDDLVGPPLRFVSELRIAAGLPEIPATQRPSAPPPAAATESAWLVVASVLLQLARTAKAAAWPWTKELASDLRPAWWVARGIGLAFLLGAITGWRPQALVPNLFDSQFLGLFSTAGLVIASVHLGRRGPTSTPKRLLWAAASIVAFIALVGSVGQAGYDDNYGYGYAEPYVEYDQVMIEAPALPLDVTSQTTNNGLVNFVDLQSGLVLATAAPQEAVDVAHELLSLGGRSEIVVDFEGHQFRALGSDLIPMVESLTR